MKALVRNAICILMTLMLFCAVLGSSSMTISVRAEELNNEQDLVQPDAADDEGTLDVCFYIRGSSIGEDIPEEPGIYFSSQYSSAIRVNGAVLAKDYKASSQSVDGSEQALLSDGFTASNDVSQMLNKLPQADDIRSVVPEFDESRHYVVWYVIKSATTEYPNRDVYVHVDGVIREREAVSDPEEITDDPDQPGIEEDPNEQENSGEQENFGEQEENLEEDNPGGSEKPTEQQEPEKPEEEIADPIPEVTLEIRALFLENGKEVREIEFDGKEHIVGGFEIVVKDKASDNWIIGYLYDCFGSFLGTRSYADSGQGTEFTYDGQQFWVNVVKAFARVTNPGDSQEVIFYDAEDHPLRTAADFIIKDSAGNVLPAKFNVIPTTGKVSVKAKDITIEAGTTVRNDEGQTLTDDSFTITSGSLLEGHRIEKVVINGSQTGAGKSVNEISSINIVDKNGKSVNYLYNIKKVNGQLILVDTGSKETVDSGERNDEDDDSKTSSVISVVKTETGLTATTSNVVINSLQAAGGAGASQRVLGARRADTSDQADNMLIRILILMTCTAVTLLVINNRKYTNYSINNL